MKLGDKVDIHKGRRVVKDDKSLEERDNNVELITPNDIPSSGFVVEGSQAIFVSDFKNIMPLMEYDIVIQNHTFKVGLVGKVDSSKLIVDDTWFLLRVKEQEKLAQTAIALYMYLKSFQGQNDLQEVSKNSDKQAMKNRLNIKSLENLEIPLSIFEQEKDIINNFMQEQKYYHRLGEIEHFFDKNKPVTMCQICNKRPATQFRQDTWQYPDTTKGIYTCDECQIMF
jgi:hypothetical protein